MHPKCSVNQGGEAGSVRTLAFQGGERRLAGVNVEWKQKV